MRPCSSHKTLSNDMNTINDVRICKLYCFVFVGTPSGGAVWAEKVHRRAGETRVERPMFGHPVALRTVSHKYISKYIYQLDAAK